MEGAWGIEIALSGCCNESLSQRQQETEDSFERAGSYIGPIQKRAAGASDQAGEFDVPGWLFSGGKGNGLGQSRHSKLTPVLPG